MFLISLNSPQLTSSDHSPSLFYFTDIVRAQFLAKRRGATGTGTATTTTTSSGGGAEDDDAISFMVYNYPLPLVLSEAATIRMYLSLLASLFLLIPFSYIPASFAIFVVKERTVKAKLVQLVSGVRPFTYWLATYTWDVLQYVL